jgi:ketosteroid isomerase-like protein
MPVNNPASEAEVRSIIEGWSHAVRTQDGRVLASHLAPGVIIYDLIVPLRYLGSAAVGDRAEQWLSTFDGPVHYEVRDLAITAGDDVAFCHSLNHVDGARKDGTRIEMWWRTTVCFQKTDGVWLVTHEHSSVPFDPSTGAAAFNLKP